MWKCGKTMFIGESLSPVWEIGHCSHSHPLAIALHFRRGRGWKWGRCCQNQAAVPSAIHRSGLNRAHTYTMEGSKNLRFPENGKRRAANYSSEGYVGFKKKMIYKTIIFTNKIKGSKGCQGLSYIWHQPLKYWFFFVFWSKIYKVAATF